MQEGIPRVQSLQSHTRLRHHDIITAARTIDKGVVDVKENVSWDRQIIHAVRLVRYMGKGTDGLHKMPEELKGENKRIKIPTQVHWLANLHTICERRENGEIAPLSVVFVVKGGKAVRGLVKKGIKVAELWYQVNTYRNVGTDSKGELGCGWGHIENKCSNKPSCGYCSGHHQAGDLKSNLVR
jgi:hypothetical protein